MAVKANWPFLRGRSELSLSVDGHGFGGARRANDGRVGWQVHESLGCQG